MSSFKDYLKCPLSHFILYFRKAGGSQIVSHAPQGPVETSQGSSGMLTKNVVPYTRYRILALMGSHGQWLSMACKPPVENIWELG